jgi:hypothetical protein
MGPPPAMMNQMRSAGMAPPVSGVSPIPPSGGPMWGGAVTPAGAPGLNPAAIQQGAMMRGMRNRMPGRPGGLSAPPTPALNAAALGQAAPIAGAAMAKGGKVKSEDNDKPAAPKKADKQWAASDRVAEDLPLKEEKKAKGGVLRRRPPAVKAAKVAKALKKEGVSTPSPYDYEDDEGTAPPIGGGGPPPPAGPAPQLGMKKGGKWIGKAIKKPGALHEDLGVAKNKKIPEKKLEKAAKGKGKVGERARLAEKLEGMRKNKGGKCDRMAAGGAAKQRKKFPNTEPPPKKFASGGKVRGAGIAERGTGFSGIY